MSALEDESLRPRILGWFERLGRFDHLLDAALRLDDVEASLARLPAALAARQLGPWRPGTLAMTLRKAGPEHLPTAAALLAQASREQRLHFLTDACAPNPAWPPAPEPERLRAILRLRLSAPERAALAGKAVYPVNIADTPLPDVDAVIHWLRSEALSHGDGPHPLADLTERALDADARLALRNAAAALLASATSEPVVDLALRMLPQVDGGATEALVRRLEGDSALLPGVRDAILEHLGRDLLVRASDSTQARIRAVAPDWTPSD